MQRMYVEPVILRNQDYRAAMKAIPVDNGKQTEENYFTGTIDTSRSENTSEWSS